jgi:hypothetical protein
LSWSPAPAMPCGSTFPTMPPRSLAGSSATDRGGLPARPPVIKPRGRPIRGRNVHGLGSVASEMWLGCEGSWKTPWSAGTRRTPVAGGSPVPGFGQSEGRRRWPPAPGCGGRGRSGGRSAIGPHPRPVHPGRRGRPARAGHGRVGRDATGRGWAELEGFQANSARIASCAERSEATA